MSNEVTWESVVALLDYQPRRCSIESCDALTSPLYVLCWPHRKWRWQEHMRLALEEGLPVAAEYCAGKP